MKDTKVSCFINCSKKASCIFKAADFSIVERELSERVLTNTFKKNQTIFLQGHRPHGVYCVYQGTIKLLAVNNEGKESILRLVTRGDIFGHRAFFSGESYNASAIAVEDCSVSYFDGDFMLDLMKRYPLLTFNLLSLVTQTLGTAENSFVKLAYKNVRERFAELLIDLKKSYGTQDPKGIRLDIKLTREEMASMIATTHETLVRLFTEFKNEGIVHQEGKVIFINDEKKLNEFANL